MPTYDELLKKYGIAGYGGADSGSADHGHSAQSKGSQYEMLLNKYGIDTNPERKQTQSIGVPKTIAGPTYTPATSKSISRIAQNTAVYGIIGAYSPTTGRVLTQPYKDREYGSAIAQVNTDLYYTNKFITDYTALQNASGQSGEEADESIRQQMNQLLQEYGFTSIQEANQKLESLQASKWTLERERQYSSLTQNDDFWENAKPTAQEPTSTGFGINIGQTWIGRGDPRYDYINDLGGTRTANKKAYAGRYDPIYGIYDQMNALEIANYNYLYNTKGKDSADDYLEYLTPTLNLRKTGEVSKRMQEGYEDHPILSNAMSIPANLASGAGFLSVAAQKAKNAAKEAVTGEYAGPVDYNTPVMGLSRYSSTVRGNTAGWFNEKLGQFDLDENEHPILSKILNGHGWGDVYQLGMSMADSLVSGKITGIPGLSKAGTVLLGGSAATQGVLDAVANGANDDQALFMGALNGAAEIVFEIFEVEELLGSSSNMVKSVLNQALTEAIGEGATTISNTLADILVMQDKSEFITNVRKYQNQGMSKEEAELQAFLDAAIAVGWDSLGGAFSGGIFGLAGPSISGANDTNQNLNTTQNSDFTIEEAAAKKDAEIVREAVAARLTELGEQGDIDSISEVIARQAAGEKLGRKDFAAIQGSKYAQQIVRELNLLGNKEKQSPFDNKTEGAQWRDNVNTLRQQNRDYAMDLSGNVASPDVQRITNRLIRDGVGEQEAAETARRLAEAGKIYGKQADDFTNSYLKGQSVEQYRMAFANIYQAGKDGASREIIKNYGQGLTDAQKEIAYLAGQKAGENNKALQSIQEDETLDVNAEGKTIRTDTNEDIEPTGFESVGENGTLSTKGGQSVSIRSVAFASYDDAVLYNTIAKVASSPNIANTLLRQFRAQDSISAIDFAAGLMEAYEAGQIGDKTALELKDAEFAGKLTTGQREAVYNRGKRAAHQKAYQRQQNVKKKSGGKKEGKLHFDRKGRKFDSVRESSLAVMDTLSKALGVDIYVYESFVNEKGQRVYLSDRGEKKAPNGYYDPEDGSIHIDLNAGQSGKGTMLFTVAHELTHFIKDWSSVKYMALADALVKQYQKRGESVSELVDNQIAKAKQNGREISRQEAFDEMVADSMESMLTDENAADFLERLAQRDNGLKEKIVSWLKELAAKLKNALSAYKDVKPDSPEGKMVAQMEDFRKEIMGIYTSALVDAGENFRENGGNKKATREGGEVSGKHESFSYRGLNQDGIEVYETSEEVLALSWKERRKRYIDLMRREYRGRTAKFERNGHVYYAEFDRKNISKPVYGESGSDAAGHDALINTGADGEIFNLVERSKYYHSEPDTKNHKGTDYFDYFIKIVQIDDTVFDMVADVKKQYMKSGGYTYTLKLNENKTIKASPVKEGHNASLNPPGSALTATSTVTRPNSVVKQKLSDRDPTAEATRAALEKENGKLREDVSRLRELLRLQGKVTGGTVMKPSSVEAAARWLNKYAGARADVKELSRMLTEFYRFIATDKDYGWEDVHQRAMVIAEYLQDNVQIKPQMSDYARDVLRDIRGSKITLDESQRAEVEYQYGSYEAFRKAAFGNVTFVKEGGIPLDSQWKEWASLYPGTFDSEITANDQPQALMDIIDAMRNSDTTAKEYAYNRESIAQDLAVAVYDSYWRVDALRTVADRDQRKINDLTARREELKGTISEKNAQIKKLRSEHRTEMDNLKKERDKTVEELKQKRQEDMKKLRTDYRKKLEDTRTRYQESREKAVDSRNRAKMREQVKKTVNELNHLLLDGDKKRHVPESMRKAVAEILSAVNMEISTAEARSAAFEKTVARYNQRIKLENDPAERARLEAARDAYIGKGDQFKAKIDALAKAYEDIKNSADPGLQDAYSDAVSQYLFTLETRVGDTRLGDMTLDQLKTVQEVLRIVMSTIRNANKSFLNERAGTIEQQAKRCISEVSSVWRKKKEGESDVGRWLRGFHYRNLKPIYLMRAIGSNALTEAYNNLRRGEDTWYRDIEGGREFFLSQSGKYGYGKWDLEKTSTFTDDSGGKVKLTLGQIMSLYAYSKREAAAEHLRIGGVVIEGEAVKVNKIGMKVTYHLNDATSHQLGPETMAEIIGTLTKEQMAFVDAMQDYLSTVMADKGNEVSLAMYGIKLFNEKNYFPIKSAKQFVDQKNEPVGEVKLKNSGFTNKTVPKANNPMVLRDFMDVWADHVTEMSNYHAFVLAIEDFNRILNYQTARKEEIAPVSLKQTIQNYMGQEAVSAVRELIQSVNGGARVDPAATFVSKAINLFKKNAVFASASVVIQQPSAIVRAAALIDPKYFVGKIIDREKVAPTWEIIKKYAPVAGIKDMGYFDTNMGKSTVDYLKGPEHDGLKDVLTGIVKREKGSFDELLSMAPGYADKVTWCAIWEAVKRETAAKHPKIATRSEEFLKICGERFTEVITKTQVYDSVFARSGNMRSKDKLMGMATSFMAEPTTAINMIYDAVLQGTRGNKTYAARAIGAVIGAAVLNAVLKSVVYAERDEDDDETFGEKYVSALVAALKDDVLFLVPNSIPFVRDIMSLVQGYSVERMDMELADDLISAVKKLYSGKATGKEKILGILGSFGNLLFPAKNMIREVEALINVIDTFRNSESQTAKGFLNAAREGWSGKTVSNARQLYEARMEGDTAHEERIAARYENEKSANSAVVSAIKEAFMDGDLSEVDARKHLILYGNTDAGDAYWKVKEWIYAKDKGTTDGYGKYNDLYDAILNGGDIQAAVEEFTENGYDEDEVMSNVKAQIGRWFWDEESETRISAEQASEILEKYFGMKQGEIQETILKWSMKKETGISFESLREAYLEQVVSESDALSYLQKYGGMTEYDARDRVDDWNFEQEHGYAYDDIKSTYLDDEITREEAIAVMTEIGGKSREDAEKKVAYWDYEEKTGVDYENKTQQYKRGIITRQQLRQALIELGDYSGADADIQIEVYDWEQSGLQGASFTRVKNWHEYCEGAGVSKQMWLKIALFSANTENDKDEDGNSIRYSAMKKVMAEINKLPISKDQKTAIARAIGWSEKNIARYKPW